MHTYYGLDAPLVIRNLLIAGITLCIISYAVYALLDPWHHTIATFVYWSTLLSALAYLIPVPLMIWSSLYGKHKTIRKIIANMPLKGNETILDVGCGRGIFLIEAAQQLTTGKAIGIDIWDNRDQSQNSQAQTDNNVQQAGVTNRVTIKTADMRHLPFSDATFDVIISSLAIHNIAEQTGREKALTEIIRVLKSGGKFIILDFQHTKQYYDFLNHSCSSIKRSPLIFSMFPPVRTVEGTKT
jgi:arsenite methyltransferase